MLKHEDSTVTQPPPAAQVRVTPEELAAAISRIEARKDISQRSLDGTIAIGEAVEQLGLDATPEEVLAEVQAGRQRTAPRKKRRPTIWDCLVLALGLGGIAFAGFIAIAPLTIAPSTNTMTAQTLPLYMTASPNLTVASKSGKIMMLSEVGDNQPVQCTLDNQSSTLQYYHPNSSALWTLIKHSGKVYVRGWMLNVSEKIMREQGADLADNRDSNFTVPVTLPLDGFKVVPQVGSIAEFHATDVHLDQYAYEKWQP